MKTSTINISRLSESQKAEALEKVKSKNAHLIILADRGNSFLKNTGLETAEIDKTLKLTCVKKETGCFHPACNLTVLPAPRAYFLSPGARSHDQLENFTEFGFSKGEIKNHILDAFKANDQYFKSEELYFDFDNIYIDDTLYIESLKEVIEEEYIVSLTIHVWPSAKEQKVQDYLKYYHDSFKKDLESMEGYSEREGYINVPGLYENNYSDNFSHTWSILILINQALYSHDKEKNKAWLAKKHWFKVPSIDNNDYIYADRKNLVTSTPEAYDYAVQICAYWMEVIKIELQGIATLEEFLGWIKDHSQSELESHLIHYLRANIRTVTFLTGPAISQESGIEVFQGGDGIWGEYETEQIPTNSLTSAEGWRNTPELCADYYAKRRSIIAKAQPNAAHLAIAQFQKDRPDLNIQIITLNVDDLHEQAGSKNILHLHGKINEVIVETEEGLMITDYTEALHHCKPNIVMFGEDVVNIETAIEIIERTEIFIILGTSLEVYPSNILIDWLPREGQAYDVNPDSISTDCGIITIKKTAVNALPELIKNISSSLL